MGKIGNPVAFCGLALPSYICNFKLWFSWNCGPIIPKDSTNQWSSLHFSTSSLKLQLLPSLSHILRFKFSFHMQSFWGPTNGYYWLHALQILTVHRYEQLYDPCFVMSLVLWNLYIVEHTLIKTKEESLLLPV